MRIYLSFYRFCIVSILYAVKGFSLLSVINIISDVKCLDSGPNKSQENCIVNLPSKQFFEVPEIH